MDDLATEMLKALQWARIKGELRGLVAMQGSYTSTTAAVKTIRWKDLEAAVEKFITEVEDNALQE